MAFPTVRLKSRALKINNCDVNVAIQETKQARGDSSYPPTSVNTKRGGVPARGEPPEGGRGDAPDHFLRSGLLRLLSSQSPRLARGSLR